MPLLSVRLSSALAFPVALALALSWPSGLVAQEDGAAEAPVRGEINDVSWVGFQQFRDVSRVFVRSTEQARYRIEAVNEQKVVLILENARIPLFNNQRQLDTRFFESPVGYVLPKVIEGPSPSVRIEITLRQRVPYQETQTDNFLAIDFKRQ